MPVLKRRSRMVSFRLSEDEYHSMMEKCISQGSRSLSDFARSAACERGNGKADPAVLKLKERVEELDLMIKRLSEAVSDRRKDG